MENHATGKKRFLLIAALLGWVALILQFYLILANRQAPVPETIIRYFSFFTILSNLLYTVCCTFLLLRPHSRAARFFARPQTVTALTAYILIVGIVYNSILRFLWNPQGLQKLVDELLHSVNPIVFLLFWILFITKSGLRWKSVFSWLIFPIAYVVLILLRGALSGFYPYPFMEVGHLGYPRVFFNTLLLILVFFLISLLLVALGKWRRQ